MKNQIKMALKAQDSIKEEDRVHCKSSDYDDRSGAVFSFKINLILIILVGKEVKVVI